MAQAKRENRGRQELILSKLKQASEDLSETKPFWSNILLQCSKNKFPKEGFNFYNGVLSYGKSSRKQEIALVGSSKEIAKMCIEFFQKHGSIYSPDDRERLKQESINYRERMLVNSENRVDDWSQIRTLPEKSVYIKCYVNDNYSDRPYHVQIRIYNQILIGLSCGKLKKTDIVFSMGKIREVHNFEEIGENVFKYTSDMT